jgi:hypothetical protein
MGDRREPGDHTTPQVDANQERTPEVAAAQGAAATTQSADAASPAAPNGPPPNETAIPPPRYTEKALAPGASERREHEHRFPHKGG